MSRAPPNAASDAAEEAAMLAGEPADVIPEGDGPVAVAVPDEGVGVQEARASIVAIRLPGRGFVTNQWTTRGILICLQLVCSLKPTCSLGECLANAATLFCLARADRELRPI